MTKQILWTKKS